MPKPTVSFIVPCYNLGHLLAQCVESILAQSFGDFEVLIMDDNSPDDTAAVARSFDDPRVIHIRHEANLGHLRNYNEGIRRARGQYIWLISADDYLRRPYVLARYVDLLERHPRVGYVFCAGVTVRDTEEGGVLSYSKYAARDCVVEGHVFLRTLLRQNVVLAAAGLVRRDCYDTLGAFPLDMPWAGDWYLWSLFAFHYDVGYFAEPMVCYREHGLSMTRQLTRTVAAACVDQELAIKWAIKRRADAAGLTRLSWACLRAIAAAYALDIGSARFGQTVPVLNIDQFEESIRRNAATERERKWIRARVLAGIANARYWQGDLESARQFYDAALGTDRWMLKVAVKRGLLSVGGAGTFVRTVTRALTDGARQ